MVYCQDEIDNYNALVGMSLLLTLCVFVMERRGVGSAIFYFSLGIIKIIFGLLLLTVLYPEDCANFSNFYGVIAIFIGLQWIYYGDQVASSTPPAGNVAIPAATLIESAALCNEYSQYNSFSDDGDRNGNGNENGENHDGYDSDATTSREERTKDEWKEQQQLVNMGQGTIV